MTEVDLAQISAFPARLYFLIGCLFSRRIEGKMAKNSPGKQMHWSLPHLIGAMVVILIYCVVFAITGSANLWTAVLLFMTIGAVSAWIHFSRSFGKDECDH